MGINFLLNGFIIGLLASMPVGAIAIMTVQRSLNNGFWAGFSIGFGALLADTLYATIAGFSVTFITDFLEEYKIWLALAGGIFLIIMGYKIYTSDTLSNLNEAKPLSKKNMAHDFISSFFLALSNPATFVGFTGFFASFGIINDKTTHFHIILLLIGILMGATTWWAGISFFISKFKHKISLKVLMVINRIAGVLVVLFGISLIIAMFIFKKEI